jgi:hypothetical protein
MRPRRKARKPRRRIAAAAAAGLPPEERVPAPPAERESVEDPIDDWAEDDADADRWLLERDGEDVQRGGSSSR